MAKSANRPCYGFVIEYPLRESIVPEADCGAFGFKKLDVMRGSRTCDDETNGVRSGIDRTQLDGCGHSSSAPEVRERVRRLVMRSADSQVRRNARPQLPVYLRNACLAIELDETVPFRKILEFALN